MSQQHEKHEGKKFSELARIIGTKFDKKNPQPPDDKATINDFRRLYGLPPIEGGNVTPDKFEGPSQ